MPELPEVETTRRGIEPYLLARCVAHIEIRQPRLRWPISSSVAERLQGQPICAVERRGKYLLLRVHGGAALVHLGMSGSLRICDPLTPAGPHDHFDLELDDGTILRFQDPRRFGALLWAPDDPYSHPLLRDLGPEPLSEAFSGSYLYRRTRNRAGAIKNLIMDSRIVVGVGNIYASEALFLAGVHPARAAGRISAARCDRIAEAIRRVLGEAIDLGGTTLRDFRDGLGRPGYFQLRLRVYGRAGEPCPHCAQLIRSQRLGQRSSYYCTRCQR